MSEPGEPEINRRWNYPECRFVRGLPTGAIPEHTGPDRAIEREGYCAFGTEAVKDRHVGVVCSRDYYYSTEHSAAAAIIYGAAG